VGILPLVDVPAQKLDAPMPQPQGPRAEPAQLGVDRAEAFELRPVQLDGRHVAPAASARLRLCA
jgi:hypothetical protein